MGVRGLHSLVDQNAKEIGIEVNLTEAAKQKTPYRVVVDGNGLLFYLYEQSRLSSFFGGQYAEFANFIRSFITKFLESKIELYVIFDGACEMEKHDTIKSRLKDRAKEGQTILQNIQEKKVRHLPRLFPGLIETVLHVELAEMGIPMEMCPGEADTFIAATALKQNADAVLAHDSDFLIFPVPYIPFRTLKLEDNQISGTLYSKAKIAHFLHPELHEKWLPLFSSLVGNDVTLGEPLEVFHRAIGVENTNRHQLIRSVAAHLAPLTVQSDFQMEKVAEIFKETPRYEPFVELIANGVKQYDVTSVNSWEEFQKEFPQYSGGFLKALQSARIDSDILTLIKNKIFFSSVRPEEEISNQLSSFKFCAPLRQRIYGLFLSESDLVEEVEVHSLAIRSGRVSPVAEVQGFRLPSAVKLFESSLEEQKKTLMTLCDSSTEAMQHIDPHCLLVGMALRFWNSQSSLRPWEIIAFLVTAVDSLELSKMTEALPDFVPYNARALHLASQFQAVMSHVIVLNSLCGFPINGIVLSPGKFFNGKVFTYLHSQLRNPRKDGLSMTEKPSLVTQLRDAIVEGSSRKSAREEKRKPRKKESSAPVTVAANPFDLLADED